MKKLTVWALLATLVVAGSAFATPRVAANATFPTGQPATTNNDDSCDIGTAPAATLLLPYFEVAQARTSETTLFTITNTSQFPHIAHVVLWTDFSYPVIDFNIYLTGYDVQGINLNDVIWQGIIAPASGARDVNGTGTVTSTGTGTGDFDELEPGSTQDFDNCGVLLGKLPDFYIERMQSAFTEGTVAAVPGDARFAGCNNVGNEHDNAVGYATIDVVNFCGTGLPTDGDEYFLEEIRFDNVLIGDYQQVDAANAFAQGNPMVHIRAIPEGTGNPGEGLDTNFDRTFYSRYQTGYDTLDRRQPLPALFAARWINGGTGAFNTNFKIWREGVFNGLTCASLDDNGALLVTETVAFDEDIILPETSLTAAGDDDVFPQETFDESTAGWIYMNLDNGFNETTAGVDADFASQNWVVVSMRAQGLYSVDFDAAWLGNGCTPVTDVTDFTDEGSSTMPGPAADETPVLIP
jgi:hypothetical protein